MAFVSDGIMSANKTSIISSLITSFGDITPAPNDVTPELRYVSPVPSDVIPPIYDVIPTPHDITYHQQPAPNTSLFNNAVTSSASDVTVARVYNDVIALPSVRVAIIVVYMLVILVAILGNILVILVIYRRRSLRRNPAVLLISNLALCDLTSCVIYRPLLLVKLFLPFTEIQLFNDQLDECKAAAYFQGMLAGTYGANG